MTHHPSSLVRRLGLDVLAFQASRFLAVGVVTTSVHYGILIALVEACDAQPVWATTIGFLTAVLLSYVLNCRYTFNEQPFGPGLVTYYVAVSMGLVLNAGVMAGLTKLGVHYLLAQVTASIMAFIWNFLAARFVVFRR